MKSTEKEFLNELLLDIEEGETISEIQIKIIQSDSGNEAVINIQIS